VSTFAFFPFFSFFFFILLLLFVLLMRGGVRRGGVRGHCGLRHDHGRLRGGRGQGYANYHRPGGLPGLLLAMLGLNLVLDFDFGQLNRGSAIT